MKKNLFLLITILTISLGYSQDSKAYIGISLGLAIPGGDISDNINTGIDLGFLNFGYRFSENWGATVNLVSSGHIVDNDFGDETVGIGYFGVGPMFTASISDNLSWDIKPQLALGLTMVNEVEGTEFNGKGNGFIFGNSLVFGSSKGFKFSINIDYLIGKITEVENIDVDEDNSFNKLSIGAGLRYNF